MPLLLLLRQGQHLRHSCLQRMYLRLAVIHNVIPVDCTSFLRRLLIKQKINRAAPLSDSILQVKL